MRDIIEKILLVILVPIAITLVAAGELRSRVEAVEGKMGDYIETSAPALASVPVLASEMKDTARRIDELREDIKEVAGDVEDIQKVQMEILKEVRK